MGAKPKLWHGGAIPVGCLLCGAPVPGDPENLPPVTYLYLCAEHNDLGKERSVNALWREWRNGARDFPRLSPAPTPVAPKETQPARAKGRCFACNGVHAEATCPPGWGKAQPAPVVAAKREVSTNGRDWMDYDRLTDADPFEAYRHRRENGVVLARAEARGYGGKTWQQHVTANQNFGVGMRQRDHESGATYRLRDALDGKPRPVRPLRLDGERPAQSHAYFTPSDTRGSGRP